MGEGGGGGGGGGTTSKLRKAAWKVVVAAAYACGSMSLSRSSKALMDLHSVSYTIPQCLSFFTFTPQPISHFIIKLPKIQTLCDLITYSFLHCISFHPKYKYLVISKNVVDVVNYNHSLICPFLFFPEEKRKER